ncbi:MAG: zinc-dependent metalloprotease [Propionibacteriaceae bacterium]|nr:zinc-dependent metalloprotease [Propionibacteriaceae bacterium]
MTTPGGFDFEQLRRLLEQFGLSPEDIDLAGLMRSVQHLQASGGLGFTPADQDPDAAWRTTINRAANAARDQGPDPELTAPERLAIADAERLAQAWLDPVISFRGSGLPPLAQRRGDWLLATSNGWRKLVEPIIDGLAEALQRGAGDVGPEDEQLQGLSQMFAPMMRTAASLMYRERLAKVLAAVAGSTLTGSEIGIRLAAGSQATVLPANVAEFTRDLDLPERDVMIHLLIRESARQRLFDSVGWLSPQLEALLAHFAREIHIDFEALGEQIQPSMEGMNLEEIVAVSEQVQRSFFKPASTPLQLEILGRLEVLLALIEGWVDHVTTAAAQQMPTAPQLTEVVRRRRASGGPTRDVFLDLLGLELRPRLVRDAENLWAAQEHAHGAEARDAIWRHPDLLPTAQHLADPLSYVHPDHRTGDEGDLDAELRKLLGD